MRLLRYYLRGWRALYDACRCDTYPADGCGQYRLQAALNATAWAWRDWRKWERRGFLAWPRGLRIVWRLA